MSSGVIAQGAIRLSTSATGRRYSSLFFREPTAILPTMGNSRLAANPTT